MRIILAIVLKNLNLGASPKTFKIQHYWLKYSNFKHLAFNISITIYYNLAGFVWKGYFMNFCPKMSKFLHGRPQIMRKYAPLEIFDPF